MAIGGKDVMKFVIAARDNTHGAFKSVGAQIRKVKGDTKGLNKGLGVFRSTLGSLPGPAGRLVGALGPLGIAGAAIAATAAIGFFAASAVKSFTAFEDSMANVRKTTGMTKEETNALGGAIDGMALRLPIAHGELAKIAAIAGQLGIQGSSNILGFTEDIAMMATAFDMSADDVATAMAKLANIYDIPLEQISNMGSAINVLGNTTAASESQLMDFAMSLGPTGQQLGFTYEQTMALGASMIEMGVNSSDAGTRLNRAFSKIGQNINELSKFMGVSSDEFAKSFQDMPMETFTSVLDKLSLVEGSLEANTIATELFGEVGAKSIKSLIGNLDGVSVNLKNVETGFAENTSLTEEFAAKTDTLKAKFALVSNAAESFKINIGQALAPIAGVLAEGVSAGISGISKAFDVMQKVAGPVLDLLFLRFHILKAFLEGLFTPIIGALAPLSSLFEGTGTAVSKLNIVLEVMKDVFTIITGLARKLGTILGTLLAKAITPLVAKIKEGIATLKEFYDKLGPIKGIIEGIKDKVGAGAKAIGEWADSFEEAVPPAEELAEAVSELAEEAEKVAPVLAESIKTLGSRLTEASGSYKAAISDISKEIDTLKDAWNLASDDQKGALEKQIEALEGVKEELERGEEEADKYFDTHKKGAEEATEKQEEFTVKLGETTVTFKGMAAEVVKNADAYATLQKNAETLLDLDWSVFTELEAELPNIDVGIGDMSSAFVGLKGILEENTDKLEAVKTSVMEISDIAAPFLEAGFQNGIKSIGSFAGALSDAGSAINTFGSLTEVNVEGCINFSTSVYSMVSALGILETQMHDMKPAFADMSAGMKTTLEAFIYPGGDTKDMEARITDPIKAYKGILDKYGLTGDWKNEILTERYGEEWGRKFSRMPEFDAEEYALEAIGVPGGDLSIFQKARDDYNNTMLEIEGSKHPEGFALRGREYNISTVLRESGDDINKYANDLVHSSKAISRAVDSQVKTLNYWSDQLTKITDALKPYLSFMRTLNEITALSTLSIDDINAGFSAITDTLVNLSSALEGVDFAPVMESLFGESLGGFEFAGGSATDFIELMAAYAPKLDTLVTFTESLSSAITNLTTAFDALVDIEDSVLLDTDKLALVLKNIEDIINNLANALSTEGGNFAAILVTAFTDLLEAADPLIIWFRKNSVQVTEFNTTLSSLLMTVTHVIDVMTALKEISTLIVPEVDDLAAGFDKAAEFVDNFDEALMKHIGLTRGEKAYTYDDEGGLIQGYENNVYNLEKMFDNVFTGIIRFAEDWARIKKKMDNSFETFEDAISTVTGLISNITSLTKAFTDMKDIVIPDAIEMETALAKIPAVIKDLTTFLGKETWTAISGNIAEFALKWESVNEGISTSIDSFSHFVGTITKIISTCIELTRIFTDMGEIVVIKSDEMAEALKNVPVVMAEVTAYLTTDSFKVIEGGLIDLSTEYKKHAKVLDEVMPSYDSAITLFSTLASNVMSLSNAFEELKDATIISSIDMDKAMQNIDTFVNRFVEALRINMGNLVVSLGDVNTEWKKHAEDMKIVMPSYEAATKDIGTLISSIVSLGSALLSLSEMGIISSTKFDRGFTSLLTSIVNFSVSLTRNVGPLIASLQMLRRAWIENEAVLVPLMQDFVIITKNFASLAYNANAMTAAFTELSENSGSLEKGFDALIGFINKVVTSTKEFYTPAAAKAIRQYVIDIGLVIYAFRYLAEQIEGATSNIEKEVTTAVNGIAKSILSLKSLIPSMFTYGAGMMFSFISGINAWIPVLRAQLIGIANMIKAYLGVSSPTELGALKDVEEWPKNLVKTFASGINNEMSTLNNSFSGMTLAAPGGCRSSGGNTTYITFKVEQKISDKATAEYSTRELERMLNKHEML